MTSSNSLGFVLFQIFFTTARSSLLATSKFPVGGDRDTAGNWRGGTHKGCPPTLSHTPPVGCHPPTSQPSVLILREVRTSAKRVALKVTVPSELSGIFMATRR